MPTLVEYTNPGVIWFGSASATTPLTIDAQHDTFVGGYAMYAVTTSSTVTITNDKNHIIDKISYLVFPGTTATLTFTFDNSLLNYATINTQADVGSGDPNSRGNLFNIDPLFRDNLNKDYRLKHIGLGYISNSPAVGLADSGKDAGAYDFDYICQPETYDRVELVTMINGTGSELDCHVGGTTPQDGYANVKWRPVRANFQEWNNVLSDYRINHDGVNYEFSFEFPSNYWVGSDYSQLWNRIMRDTKAQRWYPSGDNGVWTYLVDPLPLPVPANATYTVTGLPRSFIKDFYKGFVVSLLWDNIFTTGVVYALVLSNTEDTFELYYLRGDEPTGTLAAAQISLLYLPMFINRDSVEADTAHFTEAAGTNPLHKLTDTIQADEFHVRQFSIRQTREKRLCLS